MVLYLICQLAFLSYSRRHFKAQSCLTSERLTVGQPWCWRYHRSRTYGVHPVCQTRFFESPDQMKLCFRGACSGPRHPLYTHLDQPFADVCRVESHTAADTKARDRAPFCSTENRQSRNLQEIREFLCSQGVMKSLYLRGKGLQFIAASFAQVLSFHSSLRKSH